MTRMIRKQIYLQKRQDALLKRLARLRRVSEAELIREAIDQQIGQAAVRPALPDPEAWDKALKFMLDLQAWPRCQPASDLQTPGCLRGADEPL